jgi:hypothetical protein
MPPQPPTREATRGDALTERVAPDPDLKLKERETTFSFADDEDRARVHSASPAVVRRLLAHDEVSITSATIHDGEGVENISGPALPDSNGDIVSVRGELPVGCLSVKTVPRNNNQAGNVVSDGVLRE